MHVTRLHMTDFRNYEQLTLACQPGVTVLWGDNAQGKTNILEALFLCCTGRSHRTAHDRELVRWNAAGAFVEVEVQRREGRHVLEISLQDGKHILINGTPASRIGQLMGHLNGVMFSPEDLRLVKEGPQERRRFMDMELSQTHPAYFYTLQRYNRILNQRNHLLRAAQRTGKPMDETVLTAWDSQLAENGAVIMQERMAFVAHIAQLASAVHTHVSREKEALTLQYRPGFSGFTGTAITPEMLMEGLAKERERDMAQANTSAGPHRDDVLLRLNGRDARLYASQGQQRSCALSMKLAQIQYMHHSTGETPILLLDDVMSELDETRRGMLLDYIQGIQTFITATDPLQAAHLGGNTRVLRVQNGQICEECV